MSSYANDRTRIGDDPDELTAACADVVELIYRPAPGRGPALTHETAPDVATALAGLLECCADAHDDETSEEYVGPHDPDASCMVCVARAALARHRGERFPPDDRPELLAGLREWRDVWVKNEGGDDDEQNRTVADWVREFPKDAAKLAELEAADVAAG